MMLGPTQWGKTTFISSVKQGLYGALPSGYSCDSSSPIDSGPTSEIKYHTIEIKHSTIEDNFKRPVKMIDYKGVITFVYGPDDTDDPDEAGYDVRNQNDRQELINAAAGANVLIVMVDASKFVVDESDINK